MQNQAELHKILQQLDGQGYGSYRRIRGVYEFEDFQLAVDKIQADPYAPPSLMRVILTPQTVALPSYLVNDEYGRIAVSDFLARRVAEAISNRARSNDRADKTSPISIGTPGQQVLQRTSVVIANDRIEARIAVHLPAGGRRIRGRQAAKILTSDLPAIVDEALKYNHLDQQALDDHVRLHRDQQHLRHELVPAGLIGFVGDGAMLSRRSGDSDLPLTQDGIPFSTPESLLVSFELPSGLTVTGMGIPEGVTVIVGGGYHGKSTLLNALERGVYSHVAGDGREWVITREDAVSIRAEDGRAVTGVDISPFISGLPSGADTRSFSTTNASGSTSQAANLVEALEAGCTTLLIDEDTSATNFMIRDDRMKRLIAADREPITPFVDRVRPLHTERGISTVLVAGGSGAFFDVADNVIALDEYVPKDVTSQAYDIARNDPVVTVRNTHDVFGQEPQPRIPTAKALSAENKKKPASARGRSIVQFGREKIELDAVSQLVDSAQTTAIAHAMDRLAEMLDGKMSLAEATEALLERITQEGLDALSPHRGHPGHLAQPRRHEIHAAVNRYRHLRLKL